MFELYEIDDLPYPPPIKISGGTVGEAGVLWKHATGECNSHSPDC